MSCGVDGDIQWSGAGLGDMHTGYAMDTLGAYRVMYGGRTHDEKGHCHLIATDML